MRSRKFTWVAFLCLAAIALFLSSCTDPLSSLSGESSSSSSSSPAASSSGEGSLTIKVSDTIPRTLAPSINMTAASYTVVGVGPAGSGASFNKPIVNGTLTVSNLVPGTWAVTVNAWNAANGTGTMIGQGAQQVEVDAGQASAVTITVAPLAGNGVLSIGTNWSGVTVTDVVATLYTGAPDYTTPYLVAGHSPLIFTVNASNNTATAPVANIPAGYYELALQLKNSTQVVMGAVEIVRIVQGQTTSGTYAFTATPGSVQVTLSITPNNPVVLGSMTGVPATVTAGTDVKATVAATDGTATASYKWFLNGVPATGGSQSTPSPISSSYDLGTGLAPGYYRLDVMAVTADGSRAGSQTISFTVIPTAPFVYGRLFVRNDGTAMQEYVGVYTDNTRSTPIANAAVYVTVGTGMPVPLTYCGDAVPSGGVANTYVGNLSIPAGSKVALSVTANGVTCTASGTQFTTFPTVTSPTLDATWTASASTNTLKWTAAAPTAGAYYFYGIQDNTNAFVWPSAGAVGSVAANSGILSVNVAAGSLIAGSSYSAAAGIINGQTTVAGVPTSGIAISGALTGSYLVFGVIAPVHSTTN